MTTFERFEREIPRLMDDLVPPHIPDYFDDLLQTTARMPQRPAWTALERWLPMSVLARTNVVRVRWRPIVAVAVLALLAIVSFALLSVGPGRPAPALPAPYGLARNGDIVVSTPAGDLVRVDLATGTTRPILATPDIDRDPVFARDGTAFAFLRASPASSTTFALAVADADGSNVRELVASVGALRVLEWSPAGDRLLLIREADPDGRMTILDAATGAATPFDVPFAVDRAMWRPGTDQLIVSTMDAIWLVGADGTGRTNVVRPVGLLPEQIAISPDGETLVYPTWQPGAEGRLHVVDVDTGVERSVDFDPGFPYTDLGPRFHPDGTHVVVDRHDDVGYRPTVLSIVDGSAVPMGEHHPSDAGGTKLTFAPDGTKVIAIYDDDGAVVALDPVTGASQPLSWQLDPDSGITWQRLAP